MFKEMYKLLAQDILSKKLKSCNNNHIASLFIQDYILEYEIGQWTTPVLNTKLFVFQELDQAIAFRLDIDTSRTRNYAVAKCLVSDPEVAISINESLNKLCIKQYWKHPKIYGNQIEGTYLCSACQPLEIVCELPAE